MSIHIRTRIVGSIWTILKTAIRFPVAPLEYLRPSQWYLPGYRTGALWMGECGKGQRAAFQRRKTFTPENSTAVFRLLAMLLLLVAAAPAAPPERENRLPARIVYSDDFDYPPYSGFDSNGKPTGFNIELIKAIGREMGMEVDVRLLPWLQVRRALEEERSAEVSAMFYSSARDRLVDYALPHATITHEIFLRRGSPGVRSLNDLSGKKVLVQGGSYVSDYLQAGFPNIEVILVASEPEALRLLSAGKADAAIAGQAVGFYYITKEELTDLVPADLPILPINYSFVVPEGRTELLTAINRGLARVRRSGEYAQLYDRWFGVNPPGIAKGVPWRYVTIGGAAILFLGFAILAWLWSLRRQVREKTRRLREELAERERAERCLRESEGKLQTILDHSTAVIFLKDLDGRYLVVNRVFTEVTGKENSEIIGRTDWELFPPELAQVFVENDHTVLRSGTPRMFEESSAFNGIKRTFMNVKFPIREAHGTIRGLGGVSTDISERKRFEQEIQAAREAAERANHAKDHFLAVLSHELRTPLTPVLAAVTEALNNHPPKELQSMLEMIQRNIELESRLIEDLLDLTRLARGKLTLSFRTVDAHELARQAVAICEPSLALKQQKVRFELEATHPYVNADPARLQQVLWNLLQNAIKFSPQGSEVVIRSFNTEDGRLVIQCIDPGMGMARDVLTRIFRPFEQVESSMSRQYGGLGLGLAISRMIIDAHHGDITAESAGPGKGSIFIITLPTVAAPARKAMLSQPEEPAEKVERLRILLVEDSEDTRRILAKVLSAKGHLVETAENVAAAKELWHQQQFDLLLSDIGLPDATGLELAAELRNEGPLRAIAFSGFGSEEDIRRSREAGFAEHLVKPLDINQLKQAVARVMSRSPVRGRSTAKSG